MPRKKTNPSAPADKVLEGLPFSDPNKGLTGYVLRSHQRIKLEGLNATLLRAFAEGRISNPWLSVLIAQECLEAGQDFCNRLHVKTFRHICYLREQGLVYDGARKFQ